MTPRPYQWDTIEAVEKGFIEFGRQLAVLPTGSGKCLGRGTPVMLYSGEIKPVEQIVTGDQLMGPDSTPRRVLSITSGMGPLYRVTPVKGESYVVNSAHILSLKITNGAKNGVQCGGVYFKSGDIANVNVLDYLASNKTFRHCAKGWRTAVNFPATNLHRHLPAYILGLWLGDGSAKHFAISKPDPEIKQAIKEYAASLGHVVRTSTSTKCPTHFVVSPKTITHGRGHHPNLALNALREINVFNNKHVPDAYKHASRSARMELLAGLLDTDGHQSNGGFDFISVHEVLSRDVAFIARSLGLAAYVKKCIKTCGDFWNNYWRVSISGDCSELPLKLPRKQAAARTQIKDVQVTGIKCIEPIGVGEYFGFEIDGDRLFLLGDFTVTHNTVIFSWLAQRLLPQRTLILAHREELIDQAIHKLHAATGIKAGKEKAEFTATRNDPVVVASVQTMIRRLDRWSPDHFKLVVADEAHHAVSDSWQRVLNHFHNAKVLGVTATPDRGDKRSLAHYFENVAIDVSLIELIKQEYLCPITVKSVPLTIDLGDLPLMAGDFSDAQLGHALEPYLSAIAKAIRDYASFRKVLAFLPLIDTSRKFTEACKQAGLSACHVDGNSPDRAEILQDYQDNKYDVLSNAMLLTEGFDDPTIDCVMVLRPTRSRPLYAQMVGRGTRIHAHKENLLLLDCLWMHQKHRVVHPADLFTQGTEEADQITEFIAQAGGSELNLLEASDEIRHQRETALRDKLAQLASRKAKFISAEQFCIEQQRMDIAEYEPTMAWESRAITPSQQKYLLQANLDIETVKGRGHASQLLNVLFTSLDKQPASPKQRWVMKRNGFPNADSATRKDAREFFNKLNQNQKQAPKTIEPEIINPPIPEDDDIPF